MIKSYKVYNQTNKVKYELGFYFLPKKEKIVKINEKLKLRIKSIVGLKVEEVELKNNEQENKSQDKFTCDKCNKEYVSKAHFEKHVKGCEG